MGSIAFTSTNNTPQKKRKFEKPKLFKMGNLLSQDANEPTLTKAEAKKKQRLKRRPRLRLNKPRLKQRPQKRQQQRPNSKLKKRPRLKPNRQLKPKQRPNLRLNRQLKPQQRPRLRLNWQQQRLKPRP